MKERVIKAAVRTALRSDRIVRFVGRKRGGGVDAALDRQVAAVLELQRLSRLPSLDTMEPPRARTFAEDGLSPLDLDPVEMADIVDSTVPGPAGPIPIRVFVPPQADASWIVYFHGGGGVIGSIRASEPVTRYLAAATRCTVASVGYRLGPEAPHPAAIDDAVAAWEAIAAQRSPGTRIAVAGDSFGGYLSAHVDRRATRKPDVQVLIYPMLDLTMSSASVERNASGYLLTRAIMQWMHRHYIGNGDARAGSPWFWPELSRACPAIVVTAGFDPLVDEGVAWAERLRAAGVTVRHRHHASLVHGFLSLAGAVRAARAAVDQVCEDIVDLLH